MAVRTETLSVTYEDLVAAADNRARQLHEMADLALRAGDAEEAAVFRQRASNAECEASLQRRALKCRAMVESGTNAAVKH